jgi:LysR family hydrogen peroxide-inducible transcriptional activator
MNLKDLKYLVALAEHKHFGKAAEACFVSQPTLSAQIKKLEGFLGAPLVERAPRNVSLTPLGERVVSRARHIVADVDELVEMARRSDDPLSGELSLGVIPTIAPYLLPKVIAQIADELPELALRLIEEQTSVLLDKLQAGEIDCAILALPLEENSLSSIELYTEEFAFATAAAGKTKSPPKLDQLAVDSLILLSEGHCFRDQALEVCEASGVTENKMYRATSLETLRSMVALGRGDTLLPVLASAENDGLQLTRFKSPVPKRTIGLAYRSSSVRDQAIAALGQTIQTALAGKYQGVEITKPA